jgi:hypothetical protein
MCYLYVSVCYSWYELIQVELTRVNNINNNKGVFMTMKQNDAVFGAVCVVLKCDGFDSAVDVTSEQREMVVQIVTEGILSGKVSFTNEAKVKYDTDAKVKGYVVGMVSHHLRNDKRLNGGVKREIKNPGSRSGSGDEQLKALKLLQSNYNNGSEEWHEIEAAIANRTLEIQATRKPKATINIDALPEALRYLVK